VGRQRTRLGCFIGSPFTRSPRPSPLPAYPPLRATGTLERTEAAASSLRPDIILWSEMSQDVNEAEETALIAGASDVARQHRSAPRWALAEGGAFAHLMHVLAEIRDLSVSRGMTAGVWGGGFGRCSVLVGVAYALTQTNPPDPKVPLLNMLTVLLPNGPAQPPPFPLSAQVNVSLSACQP